jgi:hypothetical protein
MAGPVPVFPVESLALPNLSNLGFYRQNNHRGRVRHPQPNHNRYRHSNSRPMLTGILFFPGFSTRCREGNKFLIMVRL